MLGTAQLILSLWIASSVSLPPETLWVVARERSAIYIVGPAGIIQKIDSLGDMRHGVVKFGGGAVYVLSRDALLSRIEKGKVRAQVRLGSSAVGFTFCGEKWVCVALYGDTGIVVVERVSLTPVHHIITHSRVAGIKAKRDTLVVSLLDLHQVRLYRILPLRVEQLVSYKLSHMPFDGVLWHNKYISATTGQTLFIVDLASGDTTTVSLRRFSPSPSWKIPHLGLWAQFGDTFYIPAYNEKALWVLHGGTIIRKEPLPGNPVFAVASSAGMVAINYSGDKEDYITLWTPATGDKKTIHAGKRIVHLRFSQKTPHILYFTSYYEHALKALDTRTLQVFTIAAVPTPSGIYLQTTKHEE